LNIRILDISLLKTSKTKLMNFISRNLFCAVFLTFCQLTATGSSPLNIKGLDFFSINTEETKVK
jgi:hypothetical protein